MRVFLCFFILYLFFSCGSTPSITTPEKPIINNPPIVNPPKDPTVIDQPKTKPQADVFISADLNANDDVKNQILSFFPGLEVNFIEFLKADPLAELKDDGHIKIYFYYISERIDELKISIEEIKETTKDKYLMVLYSEGQHIVTKYKTDSALENYRKNVITMLYGKKYQNTKEMMRPTDDEKRELERKLENIIKKDK